MAPLSLLFLLPLSFFLLSSPTAAGAAERNGAKRMFVFGDSYADTGNWKNLAPCWKAPYGITYPGKPAGRFSDGRILTDFIASHYSIRSPVPYEQRETEEGKREVGYGMNFAYGGTGVFDTQVSQPNMTTQINLLQQLLEDAKLYTKSDLDDSISLVSVSGNDYATYIRNGSQLGLPEYTKKVIEQLIVDLKRIRDLGVPRIGVTAMEPIGCLPAVTVFSKYKNCSEQLNAAALVHNELLHRSIAELNNQSHGNSTSKEDVFFVLDLHSAFMSALKNHQIRTGVGRADYEDALSPCCQGSSGEFSCGSKEGEVAKYTVCKKPELAFFWDSVHPAQHGWYGVYLSLRSSLPHFS